MTFRVTILGSSAAMPAICKHTSAHVLNVHEQFFLIDCGEGTQHQLMKYGISPLKLNAVFITHLHGDHMFGIFGLISTMGMLGRRTPLQIYAPWPFGEILDNHLKYFDGNLPYIVQWIATDTRRSELIFENKILKVYTVPLRHKIPCAGFLFCEKTPAPNIRKEFIERYSLGIAQCAALKRGEDIILGDGTVMPNVKATYQPYEPRSYAYLSDTLFSAKAANIVKGVDLLYHEATFMEADRHLAVQTGHSTAKQAAKAALIAEAGKLLIGHISSRYKDDLLVLEEAKAVFKDTELAKEGKSYDIALKKL